MQSKRGEPTAMVLASPKATPAVAVSAERNENGRKTRRYLKDLARAGQFYKSADDLEFEITPATLSHWTETYQAMRTAGRRVPVVKAHFSEAGLAFSEEDADANRGWLEDVFVEGDRLRGLVELYGDEADRLAACNDVSIYVPAEYEDDQRRKFRQPIMHVALTAKPVISGLGPFMEIAASNSKTPVRVPVLVLQEQAMPDPSNPSPTPASPKDAIREAIKAQVVAVMDDDSIDDAAAFKRIKDLFKARAKALGVLDTMEDAPEKPAEGASDPAASVAASAARSPDPMLVRLTRKSRSQDLDALVASGRINKATRDKLAAQWVPADDKDLALSIGTAGCDQFDSLVAALRENEPVAMGSRTGPQTLALSNPAAPDADATKFRQETADRVAKMAGVKKRA